MKSFSILAIAALAYTANADRIRASCTVLDNAGEKTGRFFLKQDLNVDENGDGIFEDQATTINLGSKGLESEISH